MIRDAPTIFLAGGIACAIMLFVGGKWIADTQARSEERRRQCDAIAHRDCVVLDVRHTSSWFGTNVEAVVQCTAGGRTSRYVWPNVDTLQRGDHADPEHDECASLLTL